MPHIHDRIDFTVAVFVVHQDRVLVVHHRKLDKWLPLGGHIELDEDPEQAALREAKEESGLDVELLGERPPTTSPGTRALIAPRLAATRPPFAACTWWVSLSQTRSSEAYMFSLASFAM